MATYAPSGSGQQIAPEDLLTLLAVARLGNFTAAAHSLGLNHTTVSRRIAALEKAYRERVLVAASDGWELSAAGRQLLPIAEDIEAALVDRTAHEFGAVRNDPVWPARRPSPSSTRCLRSPRSSRATRDCGDSTHHGHPTGAPVSVRSRHRDRRRPPGRTAVDRQAHPRLSAPALRFAGLPRRAWPSPQPRRTGPAPDDLLHRELPAGRRPRRGRRMRCRAATDSSAPPRCTHTCSPLPTESGSGFCRTSWPAITLGCGRCCPISSRTGSPIGPRSATNPSAILEVPSVLEVLTTIAT